MVAPVLAAVASNNNNSTSYTVAVPTGTANNDLLIGAVASDFGTAAGNAFPTPAWTALATASYDGGTNFSHLLLYARIAASEPANYSISHDSSDSVAAILRITGWDLASGISGAVRQVAPSTVGDGTTAPTVTPFGATDLMLTFHCGEGSSGGTLTWTPPSGMTESVDRQSTTWMSMEINWLQNPSSPSGTKVATPSIALGAGVGAACSISIAPTGGGGGSNWTQNPTDSMGLTDSVVTALTTPWVHRADVRIG